MQKKNLKLIEVCWRDTAAKPGWCDDADIEGKVGELDYVFTVGYLLKKTRHKLIMTIGISTWDTYMEILTIPRCSVIEMIELVRKGE